jgi:hypothetical protein
LAGTATTIKRRAKYPVRTMRPGKQEAGLAIGWHAGYVKIQYLKV